MLRSAKDLIGYAITATDGDIGSVDDLFFDDETWTVRYLVVDTGTWLPGRRVLILPRSLHQPDWAARRLPVSLSRERVKNSPSVDTAEPVSRQKEAEYLEYYGYPAYWHAGATWGPGAFAIGAPLPPAASVTLSPEPSRSSAADENHLRSVSEVIGYALHAIDGQIGRVLDFIVDDVEWDIRHLAADTSDAGRGRHVLLSPHSISGVDWAHREVRVGVSREDLKSAPEHNLHSR